MEGWGESRAMSRQQPLVDQRRRRMRMGFLSSNSPKSPRCLADGIWTPCPEPQSAHLLSNCAGMFPGFSRMSSPGRSLKEAQKWVSGLHHGEVCTSCWSHKRVNDASCCEWVKSTSPLQVSLFAGCLLEAFKQLCGGFAALVVPATQPWLPSPLPCNCRRRQDRRSKKGLESTVCNWCRCCQQRLNPSAIACVRGSVQAGHLRSWKSHITLLPNCFTLPTCGLGSQDCTCSNDWARAGSGTFAMV